jgi:hypothetical protein
MIVVTGFICTKYIYVSSAVCPHNAGLQETAYCITTYLKVYNSFITDKISADGFTKCWHVRNQEKQNINILIKLNK